LFSWLFAFLRRWCHFHYTRYYTLTPALPLVKMGKVAGAS
jgi:hypothetical protein